MSPKRTKAYTTTSGERVTKYDDGTETRVDADVPTVSKTTPTGVVASPTANAQSSSSTAITASSLAPTTPMKLAEPAPATQASGMMAEIADQTDQYTQNLQAQTKAAEAPKQTALQDYLGTLTSAKGLTGLTADAYAEKGGVDSITTELNDINDKIRREQLALRRRTEAIQKSGGGLEAGANAEIQNIERESFSKQADLAVIQMAVQGRYDSAKEIADRAVAAKLEQQTNQLAVRKFVYEENKDIFNKAEQRQFEAETANRERALEAERQNQQSKYELGLQASADGAPSSVVERMFAAKTREEALAIGGGYIGALDRAAKQASIRASNASANASYTNALINRAQAGDPQAAAELGLTTNGVAPTSDEIAYARQYAATGQIPTGLSTAGISFGRIQELAADLPKPTGTLVNRDTGVAADLNATERTGYESLYTAVNTDLKTMQNAWKEAQRTNFGSTGILGGISATVAPPDAMVRYNTAKKEFLAKLLQARSGAAVTETEYNRYAKLIPGSFSTPLWMGTPGDEKLSNLDTQLNNTLKDKLASRGLSIYGYSTVDIGGQKLQVGETITNAAGQTGRVNPDGTITLINQ